MDKQEKKLKEDLKNADKHFDDFPAMVRPIISQEMIKSTLPTKLPCHESHYDNDYSEGILMEWGLAGPDGAWFCIFPIHGFHTTQQVASVKQRIKYDRNVVGAIKVQWVQDGSPEGKGVYLFED